MWWVYGGWGGRVKVMAVFEESFGVYVRARAEGLKHEG
jgi:hypothetical protein